MRGIPFIFQKELKPCLLTYHVSMQTLIPFRSKYQNSSKSLSSLYVLNIEFKSIFHTIALIGINLKIKCETPI